MSFRPVETKERTMPEIIRVAIAEDEASCRHEVIRQLHIYEKEQNLQFDITVFSSALDLIEAYRPVYDILFLDIEMPILDGLSAAQRIYEMDEHAMIVFITHIAKYAVQSYDVRAADYVLKPLQYSVFSMKLNKLLRRIRSRNKRFVILQGQSVLRRIATEEIYFVEVADHRLTYHTADGDFSVKGTMRSAAQELEGQALPSATAAIL